MRLSVLALIGLLIVGCDTTSQPAPSSNGQVIGIEVDRVIEETDAAEDKAVGIVEDSRNIKTEATKAKNNTIAGEISPAIKSLELIDGLAGKIENKATGILENLSRIESSSEKLAVSTETIKALERENSQLRSDAETAQQDAKKGLYQTLGLMFALGLAVTAGGAIVAIYQPKLGITLAIIGGVATGLAVTLTFFLKSIAFIGFIILGGALLAGAWLLGKAFWDAKTDKKTAEQNIKLIQMMKQDLPEDKRREIFGDRAKPGLAQQTQDKAVRKNIKKIKERQKREP